MLALVLAAAAEQAHPYMRTGMFLVGSGWWASKTEYALIIQLHYSNRLTTQISLKSGDAS